MKQNIKLFLSTLISNNSAIDAGRKKPWYAAIIVFFISILLAVIPSTVIELQKHGDKNFASNTYYAAEATTLFAKDVANGKFGDKLLVYKVDKQSTLLADETVSAYYEFTVENQKIGFAFQYCNNDERIEYYSNAFGPGTSENPGANVSYILFSPDKVYISLLDPSNPSLAKRVLTLPCIDAYKKVGEKDIVNAYEEGSSSSDTINKTWSNWKTLIKNFYNQARLRNAGIQLAVSSAIDAVVVLIMGLMVWILTRGKNNPYHLFSVWHCFATAFWAALTPAILTVGLGFLIQSFASMMFPLLVGVRVMWLTMKSLRPDGSGYAAN